MRRGSKTETEKKNDILWIKILLAFPEFSLQNHIHHLFQIFLHVNSNNPVRF